MSRLTGFGDSARNDHLMAGASPTEREAIREQLEKVLADPHFTHSKRYPKLLRYIVEHALEGSGQLKERTLGVEVFGRHADYDTNEDPVVRVTAGEIRKRIAQYYHEPGHELELRIDLPLGSYVPEFHLPAERPVAEGVNPRSDHGKLVLPRVRKRLAVTQRVAAYFLLVFVAGFAAIGTARVKAWVSPRPIDDFWAPVLDSAAPSLVAIGEPSSLLPSKDPDFSVSDHINRGDRICFSDANALFRLAVLLGSRGKMARLQPSSATSLTDLRQGPVVLISGIDNEWTMRIGAPLRYHFGVNADRHVAWIEDSQNPSRRDWSVDFKQKYSQLTQDYAIVSRFSDPTTGQPVVIAAGLGENGTIAAGEFLTDPRDIEDATKSAPSNWRVQNVEFVIATQVINEKSGRPRVLTTQYWPR